MPSSKKVVLTIEQRMKILEDLKVTPIGRVAAMYHVHRATIHRIRGNATTIAKCAQDDRQKNRQRIRKPTFETLEQKLRSWITERKTLGDTVTDALLLEKAAELRETMASCSTFKVSKGWLLNFKKRNGMQMKQYVVRRKKGSSNQNEAQRFISEFGKLIKEEEINLEYIYNMDETGLLWKAVPVKTLVSSTETCMTGCTTKKDRMSLVLCANATGTHKITPFLIYRFRKPRALSHCMDQLPVVLASEKNGWLDRVSFTKWFNHFKKSVQAYHLEKGIRAKVILLLDNYMSQILPLNYVEDENIKIKFLPSNTTLLIQPMDQGIIERTKRSFRHKLLQCIGKYEGGAEEFYKKYTIKDCINMISEAWDEITRNNIENAWKKIIPHVGVRNEGEEQGEKEENTITEMQRIMAQISAQDITSEDIVKFSNTCSERERRPSGLNKGTDENLTGNSNENGDRNMHEYSDEDSNEDSDEDSEDDSEDDSEEDSEEDRDKVWAQVKTEVEPEVSSVLSSVNSLEDRNEVWIKREVEHEASTATNNERRMEDKNEVDHEASNVVGNEKNVKYRDEGTHEVKYEVRNENRLENRKDVTNMVTNENRAKGKVNRKGRGKAFQDRGIKLNDEERREVQDIIQRLEKYNHRVPRSKQLLLQSIKLLYLGDTSRND